MNESLHEKCMRSKHLVCNWDLMLMDSMQRRTAWGVQGGLRPPAIWVATPEIAVSRVAACRA